ncbi:MAG: bacillithiol biosynthesis deacetylase BshB1, partial [Chitinophagaceae bacterium]
MEQLKLDILAIAAHPDDIELGCSGAMMQEAEKGKKIGIVDLTNGELGTRGSAKTRREEADAAANVMKLNVREDIGLPDGFFENKPEHQIKVIQAIRKYRPEIVLTNAPHDRHPDHGRASKLVYDSCFLSGLVKIKTEWGGKAQQAWRPKQIFYFIQAHYIDPEFIIDISRVIERKKEAIRCFKTQFLASPDDPNQTYISTPKFFDGVIQRNAMWGTMIGTEYAEGFLSSKKLGLKNLDS